MKNVYYNKYAIALTEEILSIHPYIKRPFALRVS